MLACDPGRVGRTAPVARLPAVQLVRSRRAYEHAPELPGHRPAAVTRLDGHAEDRTSASLRSRNARSAGWGASSRAREYAAAASSSRSSRRRRSARAEWRWSVLVEPVDPVDQHEARLGPVRHRDGHGAVQLDHGRRRQLAEPLVERRNLRPVGLRLQVERRDRGLELVRPGTAQRQRPVEHGATLLDPLGVPQRAILVVEQHELARGVEPRSPARVVQQHQREQAEHLGLVGHQHREHLAEPDRLVAQLGARRRPVALVEDQVDDGQHRPEPLGQQVVGRDAERDPGRPDLPLRPHEPLGHRRLGDEERARDLVGREPAEGSQRERHLRLGRERGMAAREDQAEPFVGNRLVLLAGLDRLERGQQLGLAPERLLAANPVDRPVARGRQQPGTGVGGGAFARPPLDRGGECLLHRRPRRARRRRARGPGSRGCAPTPPGRAPRPCDARSAPPRTTITRPDLDRAVARRRDPGGPLDRLVERVGVDQVVAAELLLRLGERAVGGECLVVLHADGGRRLRRLQRVAGDHRAAVLEVLRERHVRLVDLALLLLAERLPAVLLAVDQQHVLHVVLLRSLTRVRRTGSSRIDISVPIRHG